MQRVAEIVGEISADRPGLGVHVAECLGVEARNSDDGARRSENYVEGSQRVGVEIVDADEAVQPVAVVEELELFGELVVLVDCWNVDIDGGQRVEVDRGQAFILAIGDDVLDGPVVAEVPRADDRAALGFGALHRLSKASLRVVDVAEHGRAGLQAGDQAVALLGVRLVQQPVAGEFQVERISDVPLGLQAGGGDILVVVRDAVEEQVIAVSATRQLGDRAADAEVVADRGRSGEDAFKLGVGAGVDGELRFGRISERLGDVFHRAANGVPAVERTLRSAQHFDALDIEHVEYAALWAIQIDVIEIDADAGLEATNRILLADAADEGGECRIGAAGNFERHVRRELSDFGDVGRADVFKLFAREGRDGQRNVLQVLFATLRSHDNDVASGRLIGILSIGRRAESAEQECRRA